MIVPTLTITLNRNGVAVPAQRAAVIATDVVAAALTAFAEGKLAKPTMPDQFVQIQIRGPEMASDERRILYENCLLAAGFQNLARGIRESLEEAAVYLHFLKSPPERVSTSTTVEDLRDMARKPVAKFPFPKLLQVVNEELTSPLQFEPEFLTIQKVRNCLEHRGGIVKKQDLDVGASTLTEVDPDFGTS